MRGGSVHFAPAGAFGSLIGQLLRSSTSAVNDSCVPSGDQAMPPRRLVDAGHLRGRAFRIHPAHEDLRAAGFALRRVGDAVTRR